MAKLNRHAFRKLREQIGWYVAGNQFLGLGSTIEIHSDLPKLGPRKRRSRVLSRSIPQVVFNGIRDTSAVGITTVDNRSGMSHLPISALFSERGPVND